MLEEADVLETAVKNVLEAGFCTSEFKNIGRQVLSTTEMTEKIISEIEG